MNSPVDAQAFKQALAHFASGVTVVTTAHEGERFGMTVAAFSSVSVAPPMILVCIANGARARKPLEASGVFAVHILRREQVELGARFGGLVPGLEDRFRDLDISIGVTGCPVFGGCLAVLECRVAHAYPGGDHTIFVGEVLGADVAVAGDALVHYRRNFRAVGEGAPLFP